MPDDPPLLVLDANILVRAAANGSGDQAALVGLIPSRARLAVTSDIVAEYAVIRDRPKIRALFRRSNVPITEFDALVVRLVQAALIVEPTGEPPPCRDEKDRPYLHCAVAASADFLVTHDKDLLVEETTGSTRILEPAAFLEWFRGQT